MKKFFNHLIFFSLFILLIVSCKSTKFDQEKLDDSFLRGDFDACIGMIKTEKGKKAKKSSIKNQLDIDMLLYLKGDYVNSAKSLMATQYLMQQSVSDMSASKAFAAAIAGENSVVYTGTVYERLLAYSMRATSALAVGDISNAKGVIDTYTGDYKDVIVAQIEQEKEFAKESEKSSTSEDAQSAMETLSASGLDVNMSKIPEAPKSTDLIYDKSDYLNYLGSLIYAANGDFIHANDFSKILPPHLKEKVEEDINVLPQMGRINVIALSGTIGKRRQSSSDLIEVGMIPIAGIPLVFKIVYPVFFHNEQNHQIEKVRVRLSDGKEKNATLIEDFDVAVSLDCAAKAPGAFSRSVFRNIVKNSTATVASLASLIAAREVVRKSENNFLMSLAAYASYEVARQALSVAVETIVDMEEADIRQGSYFPNKASAAGFNVAPGIYSVTIEYLSKDNLIVERKKIDNVKVQNGLISVVVSSCEK